MIELRNRVILNLKALKSKGLISIKKSALYRWFSFQNIHQLSCGMFTSNAIRSFGV
ncbi:hypothetical protein LV83_00926 [Algoriphagus yeomjeoni]|uniref:Uncharacterized protein n=1 Tax=Algoriphagus yeomjeoni TaxID=291403 RepID=A0A327PNX4_9BACT|nr:hypothetical protein LV83_00926 [Algoriphagus yeomjeoni]